MKKTLTEMPEAGGDRDYSPPRLTRYRRPQLTLYGSLGELTQSGRGRGREIGSTYAT